MLKEELQSRVKVELIDFYNLYSVLVLLQFLLFKYVLQNIQLWFNYFNFFLN